VTGWEELRTAPLRTLILLANHKTGIVEPGHGEWVSDAAGPTGIGRFRATYWAPMPTFEQPAQGPAPKPDDPRSVKVPCNLKGRA
jgi:hypothetical protein